MGWGGSQVVTLLAFYPVDPSSNPTEVYNFSCGYTKKVVVGPRINWSTICCLFIIKLVILFHNYVFTLKMFEEMPFSMTKKICM